MHARLGIAILFSILCLSCKPAPFKKLPLVNVEGTLLRDGAPLNGAVLRFYKAKRPFVEEGRAVTKGKGTFLVHHKSSDPGLLPGEYKVAVNRRLLENGRTTEDLTQGREEMPAYLTEPATTTLEIKIDKGGSYALAVTSE